MAGGVPEKGAVEDNKPEAFRPRCGQSGELAPGLADRIDDPELDVEETTSWYCSMPAHRRGNARGRIPADSDKARGPRRQRHGELSDARMSGRPTARSCCTSRRRRPSVGRSPMCNGDRIQLSVAEGRVDLLVDPAELETRRSASTPPVADSSLTGYRRLFVDHVTQADLGCDFNFSSKLQSRPSCDASVHRPCRAETSGAADWADLDEKRQSNRRWATA